MKKMDVQKSQATEQCTRRCGTDSPFCLHRQHQLTITFLLWIRLSIVRMLSWAAHKQKKCHLERSTIPPNGLPWKGRIFSPPTMPDEKTLPGMAPRHLIFISTHHPHGRVASHRAFLQEPTTHPTPKHSPPYKPIHYQTMNFREHILQLLPPRHA